MVLRLTALPEIFALIDKSFIFVSELLAHSMLAFIGVLVSTAYSLSDTPLIKSFASMEGFLMVILCEKELKTTAIMDLLLVDCEPVETRKVFSSPSNTPT